MSTRCVVVFKDERGRHSVYKHHDGYPDGLLPVIKAAKKYAWKLPRFEADEFAAAFVTQCKLDSVKSASELGSSDYGGGVRLTHSPDCHGDLEYVYYVSLKNGRLFVEYKDYDEDTDGYKDKSVLI